MKHTFISIFFLFIFCKNETKHKQEYSSTYVSKNIPQFFEELYTNHKNNIISKYRYEYSNFCDDYSISKNDIQNQKKFHQLRILHEIFTANGAQNYSTGEILKIPYLWHWTNPNPRYEIILKSSNEKLYTIKPPKEFSKYKSYADIDRTPPLFLKDLFDKNEKYKSNYCESFSTFGWCSEREMSFNCLLDLLGYEAKIFTNNNHCWTVTLLKFTTNKNTVVNLELKIDNTFNLFNFKKININEIKNFKTNIGNAGMSKWYNDNAHSQNTKNNIFQISPSIEAMQRIDLSLFNYLTK